MTQKALGEEKAKLPARFFILSFKPKFGDPQGTRKQGVNKGSMQGKMEKKVACQEPHHQPEGLNSVHGPVVVCHDKEEYGEHHPEP